MIGASSIHIYIYTYIHTHTYILLCMNIMVITSQKLIIDTQTKKEKGTQNNIKAAIISQGIRAKEERNKKEL